MYSIPAPTTQNFKTIFINFHLFSPFHPLGTILQSNLIPSGFTKNFLCIISSPVGAIFCGIIQYYSILLLKILLAKIIYYFTKSKGNKLFNNADNLTLVNLPRPLTGTAVAHWLKHCITNRKVAGSIPDGVIGISH